MLVRTPLKRMLSAIKDGTHGTHARVEDGRPLLSAKNVHAQGIIEGATESLISEEEHAGIVANGFPRRDDVLLTIVGTIGRSCVFDRDEPIAFQRSVAFLRPNKRTSSRYLNYLLQTPAFQQELQLAVKAAAQSGVYLADVQQTECNYVRGLDAQTTIANYLDAKTASIDALIAKKELLIEELKKYQEAVIAEAVKPRTEWSRAKVKGLVSALPKSARPAGEAVEGGRYPFFVSGQQVKACAIPDYVEAEAVVLATGGGPAVHYATGSFSFSTDCWALVAKAGGHTGFLYYLFVSMAGPLAELGFRGAGIKHLDKDWLMNREVAVPEQSEQAAIAASLTKRTAQIQELVENAKAVVIDARKLRASLISEAVTGKLKLD